MYKQFDYIIIGAGLFGSVAANILDSAGYKICILEKRDHIGGNCFDTKDEYTDILYHQYGPHVFHCNDLEVLNFIKKFCNFNSYFHQVFASVDHNIYQLPFNLSTINKVYNKNLSPSHAEIFIKKQIYNDYKEHPENLEEKVINLIGKKIYNMFIKEYTEKQWGKSPRELPIDIIKRIPFRYNYNSCYFNKAFHGIPIGGYTNIFKKLLTTSICLQLNTDYFDIRNLISPETKIIFTGTIDSYYNYKFGRLKYRSLYFKKEIHNVKDYQGTSVINYPQKCYPWTRICEPRHFHPENEKIYSTNHTLIIKEFSKNDDGTSPYYPINSNENMLILNKYKTLASIDKNIYFGGRLGEYQYYDMEDTIKSAIRLCKNILNKDFQYEK